MSPDHLRIAAWILGLVAAMLAASAAGEWLTRRKLERWARAQGCQLLEYRGAPFWHGPRAWRGAGWVLYTSHWYGLGPQGVEVRWEEITPSAV